jgi:fatty acid desaturase
MFCPLGVNFHVEHHMQASVPIYNLGVLHDMLKRAGYYDRVTSPKSYWGMLSQVTS